MLEHVVDPMTEIKKIGRLLKPGGLLVVEVPNVDGVAVRLLKGSHRHFVQDHVSFFSRKTLSRALEMCGYEVVDSWFPSRVMTLSHLLKWIQQQTHLGIGEATDESKSRSGSTSKFVKLNLRDIVTVIGKRVD